MGIYSILDVKHILHPTDMQSKYTNTNMYTKSVIEEVPLLVLVFLSGPRGIVATTTHVLPFLVAPHPLLALVRHHVTAWKDF